jgi:hypothetical protein
VDQPTAPPPVETADNDLRTTSRTAVFVAATLVMGNQVDPVRVRNMSPAGALVEGAVLPTPGQSVELVRGHLRVSARSRWVKGNQCGLSFTELVDTNEWIARIATTHQQRVDSMIQQARKDMAAGLPMAFTAAPTQPLNVNDQVAAAIQLLETMEDKFTEDSELMMRHADQMQALDRILQLLRAVSEPRARLKP